MAHLFDLRLRFGPGFDTLHAIVETMDRHGIQRAAMVADAISPERQAEQIADGGYTIDDADHAALLAVCALAPDRLEPIWLANPHRDVRLYRRCGDEFRGMELSPATYGIPLTDWTVGRLVDAAADAGHTVYVTCLDRPGCDAIALSRLAERFSDVTFVLGGGGAVHVNQHAIAAVEDHRNVMLDGSACNTRALGFARDRLGADRILFASHTPWQDPSVELAKFATLDLSEPDRRKVMHDNASRLIPARADAVP